MYRSKSSVSLRNLANSIKNSINFDQHKSQKKQFIPLKNSHSTINLINNDKQKNTRNQQDYLLLMETRKSRYTTSNILPNNNKNFLVSSNIDKTQKTIDRKQRILQMTRKTTKQNNIDTRVNSQITKHSGYNHALQLLYSQHKTLSKQLQQNQHHYDIKKYNKYLTQVESLSNQLKQICQKQLNLTQHRNEIQNRLNFMYEEMISIQMNYRQRLAEKQYCEEFLDKYRGQYQYKEEAKLVMEILQLQYQNQLLDQQKINLYRKLTVVEDQYKEWKVEQNIQLKEKRFQNKLKQYRIQLMKIQQDLDQLTQGIANQIKNNNNKSQQLGIRKIRQYICAYFKLYNQMNLNHISHGQIADGIDIFLCKDGLIKDFTKFITTKTQKICLVNGLYSLKLTQYLDCLRKVESMFGNQKNQVNKVLGDKFKESLICLKEGVKEVGFKKQKNIKRIKELEEDVEKILAQDSLSLIQLMNKNGSEQFRTNKQDGFINVHQIKQQVKQLKLVQAKRIKRVKQIFNRLKNIQNKQNHYFQSQKQKQIQFQSTKQQLKTQIIMLIQKITQISSIKKGYELKRDKYENMISQAINKMKQKDHILAKLKKVQLEIQNLRKQKIVQIQAKFNRPQNYNNQFIPNNFNRFQSQNFNNLAHSKQTSKHLYLNSKCQENQTCFSKSVNLLTKFNTQALAQIKQNRNHGQQKVYPQYQVTKKFMNFNQQLKLKNNEQKLQRNTEASPRGLKQLEPFSISNNILGSKSNLIESKTMPLYSNNLKKSFSTVQLHQLHEKQTNQFQNTNEEEVKYEFVSKRHSIKRQKNKNSNSSIKPKSCASLKNLNKNTNISKVQSKQKTKQKQSKHKRIPSFQSVKQNLNPKMLSSRNTSTKKLSLQVSKNGSQIKNKTNPNKNNNIEINMGKKNISSLISAKLLHR